MSRRVYSPTVRRIRSLREYGYAGRWMSAGHHGKWGVSYKLSRYTITRELQRAWAWPVNLDKRPRAIKFADIKPCNFVPFLRYETGWPEPLLTGKP